MEAISPNSPQRSPEAIECVRLHEIEMDTTLQSRDEMSPKRVRDYEIAYRNGAPLPPLLVTTRPGGPFPGSLVYVLLDGFHRYQALCNIDAKEANVRILPTPADASPHELRWLGGRENLKNGLPLGNKDVRELFRAYVRSGQHRKGYGFKSYREIAEEIVYKSHQTIANWMEKDFSSVARAMGRNDDRDNKAEGTGVRQVDMPVLEGRDIALFHHDLLEKAKAANNESRWAITQQVRQLLAQLEQEAPCTQPPEENYGF